MTKVVVAMSMSLDGIAGPESGVGLEILVLDTDGRITTDYQFIEG